MLFELRPGFVMAHFLLSMVILADAVVLHDRAGRPDDAVHPARAGRWPTATSAGSARWPWSPPASSCSWGRS